MYYVMRMKKVVSYLKTKSKIILIILVVGVIIFVGQRLLKEDESETETQEYIVTTVERGTISNSVSATGLIETANYLSVTTSVNGIVKEVFVNEGDTITKGQPIMEITLNSDGEESYLSAQSSYLAAKNALDSAKTSLISSDSSLISAEEAFDDEKEDNSYQSHDERVSYALADNSYEIAQANYNNQLEVINQKQVALSKAWLSYQAQSPIVLAPDSGVVANIVVVEGMDISNSLSERTSSSVASIKKEGTPIASLSVSELDINNVSVGQETRITLTSNSDEEIIGKVVGIDKIGEYSGGVTN